MTQVLFTKIEGLSDAPQALLKLSECPHCQIIPTPKLKGWRGLIRF